MELYPDEVELSGVFEADPFDKLYKGRTPEEDLERRFSRLRRGTYAILELPETDASVRYNCKGYAAGFRDKVRNLRQTLEDETPFFRQLGYVPIATPGSQTDLEQVAIYVKNDVPVHCALQEPGRRWVSKIGSFELIEHELNGLTGDGEHEFGRVAIILARQLPLQTIPSSS